MKITIESTSKLVHFQVEEADVPARIWEGFTDDGIPVHCYITRICPSITEDKLLPAIAEKFARELTEQKPPSVAVQSIPLRMIL